MLADHRICHYNPNAIQCGCAQSVRMGVEDAFISIAGACSIRQLIHLVRGCGTDYGGATLDHQRAFVVRYQEDEDVDLAYHYDDSEASSRCVHMRVMCSCECVLYIQLCIMEFSCAISRRGSQPSRRHISLYICMYL